MKYTETSTVGIGERAITTTRTVEFDGACPKENQLAQEIIWQRMPISGDSPAVADVSTIDHAR